MLFTLLCLYRVVNHTIYLHFLKIKKDKQYLLVDLSDYFETFTHFTDYLIVLTVQLC